VPRTLLSLLVAVLVGTIIAAGAIAPATATSDVRLKRSLYADSRMTAAVAAKKSSAFATLGKRPQAFWATDYLTVTKVRSAVRTYANLAAKKKRTPVVVAYAIPDRDCGQHSAGGLDSATYKKWIAQLASGLKGKHAMLVLEPDALAMLDRPDCDVADRTSLLRYATKKLKAAGVWTYLDAGNSRWVAPSTMAARLTSAGIADARGFATNVASFQTTAAETARGKSLLTELKALKVTGKKFVIDTSRNGATVAAGDFCNPTTARVGRAPKIVNKDNVDAYLWVKHPGESDGQCNGGPTAGQWWPAGARLLLGK
jgi:endoglucanase